MARKSQQSETVQVAEETGMDPAVIASAASVVLSWYFFFAQGDRERGIFVGLWPPTILAFASYFEQQRMKTKLQRMPGSRLVERVESMMGSQ